MDSLRVVPIVVLIIADNTQVDTLAYPLCEGFKR